MRKKCQWFIVSNYEGWVFGAFSAGKVMLSLRGIRPQTYIYDTGWTRAWTTDIIAFNDLGPTAIETIVFWLASSLGIPGGFPIPEVCDEPVYRIRAHPCTALDVMWERHQQVALLALSQIS